ncbi:MAG TPA: TetR family transcriptional regulator [Gemmatimonadales bacterium]|nr:TetR family transcriptional regulator [Gemmatimonadales bacterium]
MPNVRLVRSTTPRWQRRKQARPGEIVAAALQLFVERGFAATRLEDVARRAGVTKGTVYLYFDGKEALFKAVVRDTIVPCIAKGEALAQAHTGTARELFLTLVEQWWRLIGETELSGIPKLMLAEAVNFPELARFYYDEVVSRGHRLIASVLERGIASGEFRAVDVRAASRLVMAPLLQAAQWRHSFAVCGGEPLDMAKHLGTYVDIFLYGISNA